MGEDRREAFGSPTEFRDELTLLLHKFGVSYVTARLVRGFEGLPERSIGPFGQVREVLDNLVGEALAEADGLRPLGAWYS